LVGRGPPLLFQLSEVANRKPAPPVRGFAAYLTAALRLELFEFFPSRSEVAELVNRRPRWREREHIKRFGEHLLQVILGGDTDRDVRIEILAACFRDERRGSSAMSMVVTGVCFVLD